MPRQRLWPGVALCAAQWLAILTVPVFAPEATPYAMMGALAAGLAIAVWWLFFSRAPWVERLGAVALAVGAPLAARPFLHESISTGMMGMMYAIYVVPTLSVALVLWALATRGRSAAVRLASLAAVMVAASASWALARTDGIMGSGASQLAWRWTETHEERLADLPAIQPAPPAPEEREAPSEIPLEPAPLPETTEVKPEEPPVPSWPGFRGPSRDGVVRGVRVARDWAESPPVELWRKPVGPGWSSFAVDGDLFYTQEQRGENEIVACYRMSSGEPVWAHQDAVRFWESNAGPGPRGTPTLSAGRVYAFGGTGILNALDARTGAVLWSRDVAAETETEAPTWGFSSSPLALGEAVIVAAGGTLAAYRAQDGEPIWTAGTDRGSYSSPHLLEAGGSAQIALMTNGGLRSVSPGDGKLLWEHEWDGFASLQPAMMPDGDILIATGGGAGGLATRRLAIRKDGAWGAEERWTSNGLKPYFNDFVVHEGHAYGFDGRILSCIGLENGERKWKGGRYGNGQLLLLADQGLLLVLSEDGDVALVEAKPDGFREAGRFAAIQGKTWNHPALAGDVLLVRNAEEMAAFRLE